MADALRVHGLADLQRALAQADRDVRLGVRAELRKAAEPVRSDAQQLAGAGIRNIGEPWSRMRVGVTRNLVYVAPRRRGTKAVGRKRPNLAALLMGRAMEPALEQNRARVEHELEGMLDTVADKFNRG